MGKASIIGYSRLIRKIRGKGELSDGDRQLIGCCVDKLTELTDRFDSMDI
jgi:hypothetical protein